MCLSKVDEKPGRKFGIGYKVLNLVNGQYVCWDYTPKAGKVIYPIGRWLTDTARGEAKSHRESYRTGFHLCLNQKYTSASSYCRKGRDLRVVRCGFRKVTATDMVGDGIYGPQVVARQIMVLGEV